VDLRIIAGANFAADNGILSHPEYREFALNLVYVFFIG
jgi:hypothetical protein